LASFAAGFGADLAGRGYRPRSVVVQLRLLAHLSGWLVAQGVEPSVLTVEAVERFMSVRRERYVDLTGARALGPLLGYLRGLSVVPDLGSSAGSPVERLLVDYREFLVRERGLMASSVDGHQRVARLFLAGLAVPLEESLPALDAGRVTGFVVAQCRSGRLGAGAGKNLAGGLRSLLRFLHVAGWVRAGLEQAVPSVAGWRLSSLPRGLETGQVTRLLSSCDRSTPLGRRDFAIVTLLSRLGLRACEVARLSLKDIDWRAGELTIRGKGSTIERLPLPHDVGEALVSYLRDGRPRSASREVFVAARAPLQALSSAAVTAVVRYACDRAGLERVGAHRLRHTVATDLLRAGTPLAQIAPILRHTSVSTTAIYAKVDRKSLRALARPWPLAGGAA
jgi:site-specific recombinase XerD